jgi:superfamily II DNA or RNA helicase
MSAKKTYRSFEDTKAFVRSLGIKTVTEWLAYCKAGKRPSDIPTAPEKFYTKQWRGYSDWLGNGRCQPALCRSYEQARDFVRKLGLKNTGEWREYCRSGKRPSDIPSNPHNIYRKQWRGFGDWLGNGKLGNKTAWRSYKSARVYTQTLKLEKYADWVAYSKSAKKAADIPASPEVAYAKQWRGWGDWLGNGRRIRQIGGWRSFYAARRHVCALGFKNQKQFYAYGKAGKRPSDIPSAPHEVYAKQWRGWGDWLGNGSRKKGERYRPYEQARDFVRKLGLKNEDEWREYCRSGKRPSDIPYDAALVYEKQWRGFGDWLGVNNGWNKNAVAAHIEDLRSRIHLFSDADLTSLILAEGLPVPLMKLLGVRSMSRVLKALRGDDIVARLKSASVGGDLDGNYVGKAEDFDGTQNFAPDITTEGLHAGDFLLALGKTSAKAIERINISQIAQLRKVFLKEGEQAVRKLFVGRGGKNFRKVRADFLNEIREVSSLPCPNWKLTIDGQATKPNLMQLHTAVRVKHGRRWANWSGTGAGKTGSAGLAAFAIKSKLTVVIANNSNVGQWEDELQRCFRGVRVSFDPGKVKRGVGSFLILNYEKFQNGSAQALADTLVKLRPDFLVFDEVQLVKSRSGALSNRRKALLELRRRLKNVRVLVMSATPVINSLSEGASLLEVVNGEPSKLVTFPSVENALALHYELMRHGLRFRPEYEQTLDIEIVKSTNDALARPLLKLKNAKPWDIERVLLRSKLNSVKKQIRPGTIIYSDFVAGVVPIIRRFVEGLGLSVAEYTGQTNSTDREHAKRLFIEGKVDVLIGSRAIGLGVDGLQARCCNLVMLSPTWTHAAFEQTYGRVYRQGSRFKRVWVILPQVFVRINGESWSWDESRYDLVRHKQTLSDCATDGVVPSVTSINRAEFTKQALEALNKMSRRAA